MRDQVFSRNYASTTSETSFISKVYGWMALALVVTAVMSMVTISSEALLQLVYGNQIVFYVLIFGELGLVMYLSSSIHKMSSLTAKVMFFIYAALNGVTISYIFFAFTATSIAQVFFITAGTFGIMSVYGMTTKRDLTSVGNLAMMALLGIIIASVVNIFLGSSTMDYIISFIGVIVFVGLTAYDAQKIKRINDSGITGELATKGSIIGALSLYLDFINLFLMLLRLFGDRK
ncbi:Bax inhibitor-1/YccA family protein [Aureibacter tunicatorum]|uniref:Modulator of FtsH protease n=1 Tax=Aureibacter tunicatorum TaxID=866807 RepID=A0AAE3XNE3_9BACT|nr:Bax inhibitor-1/YccA family protein [Aureibacter tunicatorum]MDR6239084.1 hypothetical protein [Aureibacter tunicatorum]BDD04990.1 membrane protein [Aureibacter tunicatorum]